MAIKVAINGFGRIGRLAFRLMYNNPNFEIVGINDLTDAEQLAYLLKYDSAQGNFMLDEITSDSETNEIVINGNRFEVLSERDPKNLPWKKLGVDIVLECTGLFTSEEKASWHLEAGAKRVLI
ncbi:MAG: type I glyceraldehyde-3-phosphate dehydrogenase, partial [Acholeplasmataceae bacterium]|nr:type I glyceraldehyde-3-phosphate dehydrogenase [Acholeplasmataceae bacterium]